MSPPPPPPPRLSFLVRLPWISPQPAEAPPSLLPLPELLLADDIATHAAITTVWLVVIAAVSIRRRIRGQKPSQLAVDVRALKSADPFDVASEQIRATRGQLPMMVRLRLYSYYKQAVCGDAPDIPPPQWSVVEYTKWQSWSRRRGMDSAAARERYVHVADALVKMSASSSPRSPSPLKRATSASAAAQEPASTSRERTLLLRVLELEEELARFTKQTMRGWLYKYNMHGASWLGSGGSKWDRRFFVLVRDQLLCTPSPPPRHHARRAAYC